MKFILSSFYQQLLNLIKFPVLCRNLINHIEHIAARSIIFTHIFRIWYINPRSVQCMKF